MAAKHILAVYFTTFCILQDSNAAIVPVDTTYTAILDEDFPIPWTFDNEADMDTVDWTYKSNSSATPTTIMSKVGTAAETVFNNYNVVYDGNGNITLKKVMMDNTGIYFCTVAYTLASGHPEVTGTATLIVTTRPVPPPEYKCKCPLWKCNNSAECNRCWIVLILIITLIIWLGGGVGGGLLIGLCITCRPEALKGCYDCKASDCSECCSKCCQRCDNNIIRCNCCCSCFYIDWAPFWYIILWWTVIGTPVAFGIFIIMKYSKQGNGDVKPKEEKSRHETRSGNTRTDQKHREQPLPPSGAGAATGIMHGRENSDGAVSRDDVDLQESGRTLPQRPMPDIPRKNERQGHDSKGRGLSANFNDDDHPLIGVNIPTQKAGALEALPEGTGGEGPVKKLKKKKKKSKDQEDEV